MPLKTTNQTQEKSGPSKSEKNRFRRTELFIGNISGLPDKYVNEGEKKLMMVPEDSSIASEGDVKLVKREAK